MANDGSGASTTEEEVWDLFEATGTPDDVAFVVAAAMKGDAELAAQLGDDDAVQERPGTGAADAPDPVKAYLKSITVEGFRGIGPKATLRVSPRPGITVVSGRNGSGKSSFAEALEYAVTGDSYRWANKAKFWKGSWRNKHDGHPATIGLDFVGEPEASGGDAFSLQIGVKWGSEATDVDTAQRWAKLDGGEQTSIDAVGWARPAEIYRPVLSYDEVGGLFEEGRSALYDALNKILGLDEIGDAEKRIAAAVKEAGEARKTADGARRQLITVLAACDDPRADEVHAELKRRPYDLDIVARAVAGSTSPQTDLIRSLRTFAEAPRVTLDEVLACSAELRDAHANLLSGSGDLLRLLADRVDVLTSALAYIDASGSADCPVCESPLLDGWDARAAATIEESNRTLADHRDSLARVTAAKSATTALIVRLGRVSTAAGDLVGQSDYDAAVEAVQALPENGMDWAEHLDATMPTALEAGAVLASQAATRASELEDAWAPVAVEVSAWMQAEQTARAGQLTLELLEAAKKWLKDQGEVLRAKRLEPVASKAREIWAQLRQESGVDLASITLEGSGTSNQRYVNVRGSVEGEDTGVLSVMSQGELHALALALFIPRATVAASPFGFLVLDDPIQAMDPAKIDGFLSVLQDLASTRQVIVFSHDDRLPAAIRRMSVDADLIEVSREPGSRVVAKNAESPAHRYIDDAFALIADENVSDVVKAKAAPGLFRFAVESAARQRFFRESVRVGRSVAEAEKLWEETRRTRPRVALAVHGDAAEQLGGWLHHRTYRKPTLTICASGVHNGQVLDRGSVTDLRRTVDDILDRR